MRRQILSSRLDPKSSQFLTNRESVLARIAELDQLMAAARAGGGEKFVSRHHARGKLLVRERIELLIDRDSPFLELSAIAAAGGGAATALAAPPTTPMGTPKPVVNEHRDIGRNDPCWCGSGKKYKRCHGA